MTNGPGKVMARGRGPLASRAGCRSCVIQAPRPCSPELGPRLILSQKEIMARPSWQVEVLGAKVEHGQAPVGLTAPFHGGPHVTP